MKFIKKKAICTSIEYNSFGKQYNYKCPDCNTNVSETNSKCPHCKRRLLFENPTEEIVKDFKIMLKNKNNYE